VAARRIECRLLPMWAKGGLVEGFGDPLASFRRRLKPFVRLMCRFVGCPLLGSGCVRRIDSRARMSLQYE
jgi:hypothetical protein